MLSKLEKNRGLRPPSEDANPRRYRAVKMKEVTSSPSMMFVLGRCGQVFQVCALH